MDLLKALPDRSIAGVDGERFLAIYPGARFVLGPAGDLGLFELGVAGAVMTSHNGFFDHGVLVEARFSF